MCQAELGSHAVGHCNGQRSAAFLENYCALRHEIAADPASFRAAPLTVMATVPEKVGVVSWLSTPHWHNRNLAEQGTQFCHARFGFEPP